MSDIKTETTSTIVPAHPGWFVVDLLHPEGRAPELYLSAVIAWDVHRSVIERSSYDKQIDHYVIAISVDSGVGSNPKMLKRPDGKFEETIDGCVFDTEADALAYLKSIQ